MELAHKRAAREPSSGLLYTSISVQVQSGLSNTYKYNNRKVQAYAWTFRLLRFPNLAEIYFALVTT